MEKIAIIGAGTMGHCFAMLFAQGGHQVCLNDTSEGILDRAKRLISANLETLAQADLFDLKERPAVEARIKYTTDLAQATAGADLVIEAIFEDVQAKKELFRELDRLAPPEAVLASNTSYLDIYKYVETGRPEKIIITHWFAPPHIIPLVEIVPGPQTSSETVAFTKKILERLGKTTIVLKKYLPGFIANRLQMAINLEVLYLLDNGYATAEEIDTAVKSSFALRTPLIGVVQRFDFTGMDMIQRALKNKAYQPPEVRGRSDAVDALVAQGRMGVVSGKGFYDYEGRSTEEIMRKRDINLLKLRNFLGELE
ncbi:MAG: 3-hydroxyacyl-CoA dehydrogenase family protein [Proteobacteria bacterium]|nr:3-hydroxyacyl-CoA dehydrogenase family protein [Pseudomonadota bacterium]MBU2519106.1 3-hydroxyacyl-CoA dehydrogenase family protein [Pseudomonadota bacterium]